tara:strand:- start:492 stop:692 length:201 start_codon:yes stop_codon:yes gene_type:complete
MKEFNFLDEILVPLIQPPKGKKMRKRTKEEIIESVETIIRKNKNNKYCSTTELIVLIMKCLEKESR